MDYRVEELAKASELPVDTIRFYQGKGLLPSPRRVGRIAFYDDRHLDRLRRIRTLVGEGYTLALVRKILDSPEVPAPDSEPLRAALLEKSVGTRSFSRRELAAEAGMPEALLTAAEAAGLFQPIVVGGEARYGESDLEMASAGLALLSAGFPLDEFLSVAVDHARETQALADRAIALFDRHVRKSGGTGRRANDTGAITEAFRTLLPEATRLVAFYFQRTLVNRALARLAGGGDDDALAEALAATESPRLEVAWR
ncbi:MAG: MerR family transcriptional regulator [Myxococcota bacterium]